jgi:hypothetical protein
MAIYLLFFFLIPLFGIVASIIIVARESTAQNYHAHRNR